MGKEAVDPLQTLSPNSCPDWEPRCDGAISVSRQWAGFLRGLSAAIHTESDPLLPQALKFHPRFHMYLRNEDDRLMLLQAECLRLCVGDQAHAKRLAADVIWACLP